MRIAALGFAIVAATFSPPAWQAAVPNKTADDELVSADELRLTLDEVRFDPQAQYPWELRCTLKNLSKVPIEVQPRHLESSATAFVRFWLIGTERAYRLWPNWPAPELRALPPPLTVKPRASIEFVAKVPLMQGSGFKRYSATTTPDVQDFVPRMEPGEYAVDIYMAVWLRADGWGKEQELRVASCNKKWIDIK